MRAWVQGMALTGNSKANIRVFIFCTISLNMNVLHIVQRFVNIPRFKEYHCKYERQNIDILKHVYWRWQVFQWRTSVKCWDSKMSTRETNSPYQQNSYSWSKELEDLGWSCCETHLYVLAMLFYKKLFLTRLQSNLIILANFCT